MDRAAAEAAARALAKGRLDGAVLGPLPESCRPRDEASAYSVQTALHEHLAGAGHGRIAGYKIGCTTPVMQAYLDIPNPCAGGVFDTTVHMVEGAFRHRDFRRVGVECEIAARLGADLSDEVVYRRRTVAPAVAAVMPAIEVVDDRYEDYTGLDTPTLIADDFFNAGCVLGEPVEAWRALDLARLRGRIAVNGNERGRGVGGDIMGHPFAALAWFATLRARRGTPLRAGEFVLLGSVVETKWVEPGDVVEIDISGLGTARARFS